MSRKARHNAQVRARILDAAAAAFCARGYRGAGIDAIMAGAGLTRGGFYCHFPSKAALLEAALCERDPLVRALGARSSLAPDALWLGLGRLLQGCLSPEHFPAFRRHWVMAALMQEAGSAEGPVTEAWSLALDALVAEMRRGAPPGADAAALRALCRSLLGAAGALSGDAGQGPLLRAVAGDVARRLAALSADQDGARSGYLSGSSNMSKMIEPACATAL